MNSSISHYQFISPWCHIAPCMDGLSLPLPPDIAYNYKRYKTLYSRLVNVMGDKSLNHPCSPGHSNFSDFNTPIPSYVSWVVKGVLLSPYFGSSKIGNSQDKHASCCRGAKHDAATSRAEMDPLHNNSLLTDPPRPAPTVVSVSVLNFVLTPL